MEQCAILPLASRHGDLATNRQKPRDPEERVQYLAGETWPRSGECCAEIRKSRWGNHLRRRKSLEGMQNSRARTFDFPHICRGIARRDSPQVHTRGGRLAIHSPLIAVKADGRVIAAGRVGRSDQPVELVAYAT